jgi:cell division protein FtsB
MSEGRAPSSWRERRLVIVLGALCIIFIVLLAVTVYVFSNQVARLQLEVATKDETISQLRSEVASKDSRIAQLSSQVNSLQDQLEKLQNENSALKAQVQELQDIVSLRKSTTWVSYQTVSEPASSYVYWTFYANYPGYVVVTIHTSTTTNNYVEVIWSAYGINYDQRVSLSSGGSAAFPVLPASVEIRVGNTNWLSGATQTVSITYRY